jgi:hypothetical protein
MGKTALQGHSEDSQKNLVLFLWRFKPVLCLNYLLYNRLLGLREISIAWEPAHSN